MSKMRLRSWLREERGAVAVYLALGTIFLFPMIAIAIDATSYYKLNTELKQAADAAALAAATKLDWTDEGLVAAEAAARNAVQNLQTAATDEEGSDVYIETVQFLRALPPADYHNYGDYLTTEGSKARYVRVITETRTRYSSAYGAVLALWSDGDNSARGLKATAEDAVAGKVTVACKAMPIFMCNPAEVTADCGNPNVTGGQSYPLYSDFLEQYPEWRRRQFRIKWIGPQSSIEPGVFGLLKPITGSFSGQGANAIAHELGMVDPSSCVEIQDSELEVKTGQTQAIVNGLNVRFDVYRGMFSGEKNSAGYAPALNRTKGLIPSNQGGQGSACDPSGSPTVGNPPQPTVQKLPQDSCFTSAPNAECDALGYPDPEDPQGNFAGRYGDGRWDALTYFNVNHPRTDATPWSAATLDPILQWIHNNYGNDYGITPDGTAVNVTHPPSRWSVYRWETAGATVTGEVVGEERIANEPLPPKAGQLDRIPGAATRVAGITKEEGRSGVTGNAGARCSNQTPLGPLRRTLNIAVVNCCAQAEELSGGDRRVKITEWAEAFITEPAQANNSGGQNGDMGAVYVEVYNAVKADESDRVVLRDYVQLY